MHALRDRPLFFLHLPKAAGTSMRQFLLGRFAHDEAAVFTRDDSREQRDRKIASLGRYRFICGHMPYALVERFPRAPFVVTFLRNPLDRAVSAFHEMRRQATVIDSELREGRISPGLAEDYAAAARMPLAEFVRREPIAAARHLGNLQAWFLSAPDVHERFEWTDGYRVAVTREGLELAKERLAACEAIGLTERMTASIEMLFYALGTRPFGEIGSANRTPDAAREKMGPLDDETKAALLDLTSIDRELYAFACDLFEERRREMMRQLLTRHADRTRESEDAGAGAGPGPGAGSGTDIGAMRRSSASMVLPSVFTFDGPVPGDGWYAPEHDGTRWFCWTGPSPAATIELGSPPGVADGRDVVLRIGVWFVLTPTTLSALDVRINGVRVSARVEVDASGHVITAAVPRSLLRPAGEGNWIAIRVPEVIRPSSLTPGDRDTRLLGIAVHRVELASL